MTRTLVDLDDDLLTEAMRIYGAETKVGAIRAALEDSVKRELRREMAAKIKAGEFDLLEENGREEGGAAPPTEAA